MENYWASFTPNSSLFRKCCHCTNRQFIFSDLTYMQQKCNLASRIETEGTIIKEELIYASINIDELVKSRNMLT